VTDQPVPIVAGPALSPPVLFGEFLATFLFVVLSVTSAGSGLPAMAVAGANGAVVAAIVAAFMPISGAHLNPAVTAALVVTNRMPLLRAIAYVPIQLLASAAATYLVAASGVSVEASFPGFGSAMARADIIRGVWAECIPMLILIVIVFQTAVAASEERHRDEVGLQLSALYIGMTVFACAGTFKSIFNPARAFGPAAILSNWSGHWIYWTPVFVAVVTALMCEHLFIAPSMGRPPNSWLSYLLKRLAMLSDRIKMFGVAGLMAYGIMNTVYYVPVFAVMWIRVRPPLPAKPAFDFDSF
jgi:glycerol uptake facilitator-like aquaporin